MRDKTVGVLLITYQSAEDLPTFLESVETAVQPLELDIVCVDNTSTDNGPDLVEEFGGRVTRNHRNVGLAAAINQAAAQTDAEWLLVDNPDTKLAPGSISTLVETARSDERIGMIGPVSPGWTGRCTPPVERFHHCWSVSHTRSWVECGRVTRPPVGTSVDRLPKSVTWTGFRDVACCSAVKHSMT